MWTEGVEEKGGKDDEERPEAKEKERARSADATVENGPNETRLTTAF